MSREGQSSQTVEAPIHPTEPHGFCSRNCCIQREHNAFVASLPKGGVSEVLVIRPRKVWYLHSDSAGQISYVIYPFRTN
ncbi:hypothetical protein I79_010597 [Cricetulus griseus]|uniref:Uncharacterized protein n=1 Tax=Cricetulus griseus TaxID=10029 RepID=G3HIW9_CRIGR|nr:hypothetical protein I79_010597 [Cricetulus griseus]